MHRNSANNQKIKPIIKFIDVLIDFEVKMAISLGYIDMDSINQTIQDEHEKWVNDNIPPDFLPLNIANKQYSVLDYPDLWSGARLFETKIEQRGIKNPANEEIDELINKAKKNNKNDSAKTEKINEFEKKYGKYLALLKERCLLMAITQTLAQINNQNTPEDTAVFETIKKEFQKTLNASTLLNLQTRHDCLKAHKQITTLSYELRNKADADQQEKIIQLEVLSKRLLDSHYEKAKKSTLRESLANDLSTITSFIGLTVGVPAAILAVIGIFVPPLLPIAGILGTIGFISYTASAISAIKMANEAIKYGRGPCPSDVKWMVFDIVLAPLYIVGGQIFSALSHAFKSLKPVHSFVKATGNIWNNIVSNVFPDIFFVKETSSELLNVGSIHTATGKLKNSSTATSWNKIGSALLERNEASFDTIKNTKQEISLMNQGKARPMPSPQQKENLQQLKDLGEADIATGLPLRDIKTALQAYFEFEKSIDHTQKYPTKEQYYRESYKKNFILANIELACDKLNEANPSSEQQLWGNKIKALANQIHHDLINEYNTYTNTIEPSTTALYGRDFAYTKIDKNAQYKGNSLDVIKSLHAHILSWDDGFRGIITSKQAQNIKDAVEAYKTLNPDASVKTRAQHLLTIQEKCIAYLNDKSNQQKGRYSFVKKLESNIEKELDNILSFAIPNEEENDTVSVLVGFKARR